MSPLQRSIRNTLAGLRGRDQFTGEFVHKDGRCRNRSIALAVKMGMAMSMGFGGSKACSSQDNGNGGSLHVDIWYERRSVEKTD